VEAERADVGGSHGKDEVSGLEMYVIGSHMYTSAIEVLYTQAVYLVSCVDMMFSQSLLEYGTKLPLTIDFPHQVTASNCDELCCKHLKVIDFTATHESEGSSAPSVFCHFYLVLSEQHVNGPRQGD
jgi:hypothetical protein